MRALRSRFGASALLQIIYYANFFRQRPGEVRQQLEDAGMPVDEVPEDEAARQSYNVAPGYYELVYRADVPDMGAGGKQHKESGEVKGAVSVKAEEGGEGAEESKGTIKETKYKLQAMKWGWW